MCLEGYEFWNRKNRDRNEALEAKVYAAAGLELARNCIPEDTTVYVICAYYPDDGTEEIIGVGTQSYGLKLGLAIEKNVNLMLL